MSTYLNEWNIEQQLVYNLVVEKLQMTQWFTGETSVLLDMFPTKEEVNKVGVAESAKILYAAAISEREVMPDITEAIPLDTQYIQAAIADFLTTERAYSNVLSLYRTFTSVTNEGAKYNANIKRMLHELHERGCKLHNTATMLMRGVEGFSESEYRQVEAAYQVFLATPEKE